MPDKIQPQHDTRSTQATPEQLLKLLDLQLEVQRGKRRSASGNRTAFRVGAVLLIFGGALAALLVLQFLVAEMRAPAESADAGGAVEVSIDRNF